MGAIFLGPECRAVLSRDMVEVLGLPDTVLTTIVESARRLCQSQTVYLYLLEAGVHRLIKAVGLSEESAAYIAEHPMPMDRDTLIGRVGLHRTTQQIPDVLADPAFGRRDLQKVALFRTMLHLQSWARSNRRPQPTRASGDARLHQQHAHHSRLQGRQPSA